VSDRLKHRHPFIATAAGLGALILLVVFAGIGWCWSGGGRGDLAGWVEAVATGLALIAASVAAVFAAGAFTLEREREDRWFDSQRSAQASLVACWWGTRTHDIKGPGGDVMAQAEVSGVWVRNASDLPITRVEFSVFSDDELIGSWSHPRPVPPTVEPWFLPAPNALASELRSRVVSNPEGTVLQTVPDVTVTMRFRDSAGTWWRRTRLGALEDVSDLS
jgi:hypothetical protein